MTGKLSINSSHADSAMASAIDMSVSIFGMLIIVLGTVGNILSLVTVTFYRSLRASTRLLFFFLAVVDLGAIYSAGVRYWQLAVFKYDVRDENAIACRVHTFVVYMAFSMSHWTLCLIATERFCLTVIPLKVTYFKNVKFIVGLLILLTSLAVLKNGLLFGRQYENGRCSELSTDIHTFVWINIIASNSIPNIYLITITTAIVIKIYHQQRKVHPTGEGEASRQKSHEPNKIFAATLMLLGVAVYQFIVSTPGIIFNGLMDTGNLCQIDPMIVNSVHRILLLFSLTNNAVNFYLYILTTEGFRRAFITLCLRIMRRTH